MLINMIVICKFTLHLNRHYSSFWDGFDQRNSIHIWIYEYIYVFMYLCIYVLLQSHSDKILWFEYHLSYFYKDLTTLLTSNSLVDLFMNYSALIPLILKKSMLSSILHSSFFYSSGLVSSNLMKSATSSGVNPKWSWMNLNTSSQLCLLIDFFIIISSNCSNLLALIIWVSYLRVLNRSNTLYSSI